MASKLAELKANRRNSLDGKEPEVVIQMEELKGPSAGSDAEYLKQFEVIKSSLKKIEKSTADVTALKSRADVEVKDANQKEIMAELDKLMTVTKNEAAKIKNMLQEMEKECAAYEKEHVGSTNALIRRNLLSTHTRHFNSAMIEFQDASEAFKESLRARIARQARIVKEDITEEDVNRIIESDDPGKFLKEAMGLSDVLIEAVAELEERHERMRKIERGVREILELFQDLATLVELQQEYLDHIEQNVAQARNYTEKAEKELIEARNTQNSTRKWLCYIVAFLIIVLIIILIVVFTLKK